MKYSYRWLKEYIPHIPKPDRLAGLLNMHAFEVESIEKKDNDYIFDIKILNRTSDAAGHLGMAHEIAAIIDMPYAKTHTRPLSDFLRARKLHPGAVLRELLNNPKKTLISFSAPIFSVNDYAACPRYMAYRIDGITMVKTPSWLKKHLTPFGIRSINIVVDLVNFVMLKTGQPMHVFDADKIEGDVIVRFAKKNENIITLDNTELSLDPSALIIADKNGPLAIAGVKGGKRAEVTSETKNIIIESANFDGSIIRQASHALKIVTDASIRFSQGLDPNMAEYALGLLVRWMLNYTKGTPQGHIDCYPKPQYARKIAFRLEKCERILGTDIGEAQFLDVMRRLDFKIGLVKNARDALVERAKKLVGRPYQYGASTMYDAPHRFDCSGFIQYLFREIGIQLPRMSFQQYAFLTSIGEEELLPGDLVFHSQRQSHRGVTGDRKKFGHVGIYIGNGNVIHASSNRKKIVLESFKRFKNNAFYQGARRSLALKENLHFVAEVPTARRDLLIEEDLIEEVGRLIGYYRIVARPIAEAFLPQKRNATLLWKEKIRDILRASGFYEIDWYRFMGGEDMARLGLDNMLHWKIANPIRPELSVLRRTLNSGLLRSVAKHRIENDSLCFFEIGPVFLPEQMTADPKEAEAGCVGGVWWRKKTDPQGSLFFEAKGTLNDLFERLGINSMNLNSAWEKETRPTFLHPHKSARIMVGVETIGYIGIIHPRAQKEFDIAYGEALLFELNFLSLARLAESEFLYRAPSKYPSILRDISLIVPRDTRVQDVQVCIKNAGGELLWKTNLFDLYDPFNNNDDRNGNKKSHQLPEESRSMAFHMVFQSIDRTLRDEDINPLIEKITTALVSKGWEVRT